MTGRTKVLFAAVVAVATAAAWLWTDQYSRRAAASRAPAPTNGPVLRASGDAKMQGSSAAVAAATPALEADPALPDLDPRLSAFTARTQFREQLRSFLEQADTLPPEQRQQRADALAQELSRYEAAGELTAAEALLLRAALISKSTADEQEQMTRIAALKQQYQEQGERLKAEWQARPDPQFDAYKAREREIVAEVMAMTEVPDGLTRDEYLRRRLLDAREQAYGSPAQ
jgi:hypothetical protein